MEALDIEGPPLSTKKSEGLLGFLDLGLSLLSLHFQRERERERERERDELTEATVKREKREANRG